MTTITKGLLGAVLLAFAILALRDAVPTALLKQDLEQRLSSQVGSQVRIGRVYVSLFPQPRLVAEALRDATGQLTVGRAQAIPDLPSLTGGHIVVRELHLENVRITKEGISLVLRRRATGGPTELGVRHVRIENAAWVAGSFVLPGIDADIVLGADGRPRRIHASSHDGRVRLEILPTSSGALQLALQARDWTPPGLPAIRLEAMDATALLETHRLEAWNVQARLGHGSAFGFLSVRWYPEWTVTGEFSIRDAPLAHLLPRRSQGLLADGRVQATPRIVMRARQADKIFDRIEFASDFTVSDALVRSIAMQSVRGFANDEEGGQHESRFERISGHVSLRRGRFDFTDLEVSARALAATGSLSIAPDRSLGGHLHLRINDSEGLRSVPLQVSGTLLDPHIGPLAGSGAEGSDMDAASTPGSVRTVGDKATRRARELVGTLGSERRSATRRD